MSDLTERFLIKDLPLRTITAQELLRDVKDDALRIDRTPPPAVWPRKEHPVSVTALTPEHFTTIYDETRSFPFIEDENANGVYGFGHTDRAEFAAAVNEYDRVSSGDDDLMPYTAEDVRRTYAVAISEERFRFVPPDTQGAVAITYVLR